VLLSHIRVLISSKDLGSDEDKRLCEGVRPNYLLLHSQSHHRLNIVFGM
jgi:hypothetical protein